MPLISSYARRRKIKFFLEPIRKGCRILEIGSGNGWVGEYLRANGWNNFVGLDLRPSPGVDIVGNIENWRELGLLPESFDVIIAFEVMEHVDCFSECLALLKPGGVLLATSPVPHMDWFLKILEWCGLNQQRTSPHHHLRYFQEVKGFGKKRILIKAGLSQWAIFSKKHRLASPKGQFAGRRGVRNSPGERRVDRTPSYEHVAFSNAVTSSRSPR